MLNPLKFILNPFNAIYSFCIDEFSIRPTLTEKGRYGIIEEKTLKSTYAYWPKRKIFF